MKITDLRSKLRASKPARPAAYEPPPPTPPPKPHPTNCSTCNGTGINPERVPEEPDDDDLSRLFAGGPAERRCPDCNGSGLRLEGKRKRLAAPAAVTMVSAGRFWERALDAFSSPLVPSGMHELRVALLDAGGNYLSESVKISNPHVAGGSALKGDDVTFGTEQLTPGTVAAMRIILVERGKAVKKGWAPTAQYGFDIAQERHCSIGIGDSFRVSWGPGGIIFAS